MKCWDGEESSQRQTPFNIPGQVTGVTISHDPSLPTAVIFSP